MNLNELLNIRCRETNELIGVGEIVALYDHGDYANDIAVYGHYEWDNNDRCFKFVKSDVLDEFLPKELQGVPLDENFDPFYSRVRKLNDTEKAQWVLAYYHTNHHVGD